MRYIIYGAGGIGGVIGGQLFHHGHNVILVCRGEHLTTIQRRGLTLITPTQNLELAVPAVGHPSDLAWTSEDVVILTVKSQDTELALWDLARVAGSDVPIICAQNGVDNERMAARHFAHVYGMVVWLPATYLDPGVVLNFAAPTGGILDAGCYPQGVDPLISQVTADLTACGFSARPESRIMRWKYAKLLDNLRNSIQAICGLEARGGDISRAAKQEALACYQAAGIDCAPEEEFRRRVQTEVRITDIPGHTRSGGSSWQSLQRGLPSIEADFLNGEIVLLGTLYGVPTPYNRLLQTVANEMARTGKPPGSVSVEELQNMLLKG